VPGLIIAGLSRENYLFTCSPHHVAILVCGRFGRNSRGLLANP